MQGLGLFVCRSTEPTIHFYWVSHAAYDDVLTLIFPFAVPLFYALKFPSNSAFLPPALPSRRLLMPSYQAARMVRDRINYLSSKLLGNKPEISVSTEASGQNEVTDGSLSEFNIIRVPYNFEDLGERNGLDEKPPILFSPLPQEFLDANPIDLSQSGWPQHEERLPRFREYNPSMDTTGSPSSASELWSVSECVQSTCAFVTEWATGFLRPKLLESKPTLLVWKQGLDRVWSDLPMNISLRYETDCSSLPNPFLVDGTLHGGYPHSSDAWDAWRVFEPDPTISTPRLPHVSFSMMQSFNGRNGAMLYGELAPIIQAMRNRANQAKAQVDQTEEEALFKMEADEFEAHLTKHGHQFARETRFPVLMLSFVGPQHGRIFYACMDGQKLVIRQSDLCSFERTDHAFFDLFSRLLLSKPLKEDQVVESSKRKAEDELHGDQPKRRRFTRLSLLPTWRSEAGQLEGAQGEKGSRITDE